MKNIALLLSSGIFAPASDKRSGTGNSKPVGVIPLPQPVVVSSPIPVVAAPQAALAELPKKPGAPRKPRTIHSDKVVIPADKMNEFLAATPSLRNFTVDENPIFLAEDKKSAIIALFGSEDKVPAALRAGFSEPVDFEKATLRQIAEKGGPAEFGLTEVKRFFALSAAAAFENAKNFDPEIQASIAKGAGENSDGAEDSDGSDEESVS